MKRIKIVLGEHVCPFCKSIWRPKPKARDRCSCGAIYNELGWVESGKTKKP